MEKNIKNQRGFTTIDAVIATIILTIFVPVMTSLIYNIGISSKMSERTSKAINYATQYLEYAKMESFDTINETTLKNKITLDSGYTVNISIYEINSASKKVTVNIEFNVGKEKRQVSLYTNI